MLFSDSACVNQKWSQRKAASGKQTTPKARNTQKINDPTSTVMDYELDDPLPMTDPQSQRSKRVKRPKKSINENLEPAFTATPSVVSEPTHHQQPMHEFGSGG